MTTTKFSEITVEESDLAGEPVIAIVKHVPRRRGMKKDATSYLSLTQEEAKVVRDALNGLNL